MARKPPGLFITGTDTGVGKTYIAALIARALRDDGFAVGVYKPVASGCRQQRGSLISDDAKHLWEAAGRPGRLARVCPQMFRAPLAPHLAATAEGRSINSKLLRTGIEYWRAHSDVVLVEGAGGLMSPVSDEDYNADLAFDLQYPLIVVVPNRVGAIHQALTTLIAAATFKEGLPVAGIMLNRACADFVHDPSGATNRHQLEHHCVPPVLAEVDFNAPGIEARVDWWAIAQNHAQ